jgi:hypothetical protein
VYKGLKEKVSDGLETRKRNLRTLIAGYRERTNLDGISTGDYNGCKVVGSSVIVLRETAL